ncbi:MAG: DUF1127 domain-containing protein [Oleiphilus sp.]
MASNSWVVRLPRQIRCLLIRRVSLWVRARWRRWIFAKQIASQRSRLAQLDAAQLRDIGISESEAKEEFSRGFWDLPEE